MDSSLEQRHDELLTRLSSLIPEADAKTMIAAALRQDDLMIRQMAEFVWGTFPPETKAVLGNTVEDLLEDIRLGKPLGGKIAKFISPAARKMMKQKTERRWD